jgi:putative multiple sugar transport system substrate-binding protein
MSERDVFERRLESAVRDYVEAAPTQIDAARLTDSLATHVPRLRRLVPLPAWRMPNLGFAWILVAAGLLAVLGMGVIATGALRDVRLPPTAPAPLPSDALETPPAVIASPAPASPTPVPASPVVESPQPSPFASPNSAAPIGILLPSSWVAGEKARFLEALKATPYRARVVASQDSATEKAAVETLIRQGIKVLILTPQDSAAAARAADEARAAGVKVIANDRLILGTAAVDYYVTFDCLAVGAAQAQYLIDRAGATKGNNLYLYAGNATDSNSFMFLEGAWEKLQPKIADGTFVIRNSSVAASLQGSPTLTHDQLAQVIAQVTTNWDFNTSRTLATGNLTAAPAAAKGTVFILAPNDFTALVIGDVFAADKDVTKAWLTGQDADKASVQAIINGTQGMTVFKDPRTRVQAAVAAAAAFMTGGTPIATTTVNNGMIDVPARLQASVTVTKANVQAALIDTGYYRASDFTGSWPGKH